MDPQQQVLRWSAYEHEHIEREPMWFWALGIAAVAIALTSVLLRDFFFGVLVLLAAAIIAMLARRPPEMVDFELSERGIKTGETMHKYEEIISFWVEDHGVSRPLLLVDTIKFMSPNLIIPIEDIDPHTVREYLRTRSTERPMREPISHKVLEYVGL